MNNKFLRGGTILIFSLLIISFVAYRSGYLGGVKSSYPVISSESLISVETDNELQNDVVKKNETLNSSKVQSYHTNDTIVSQNDTIVYNQFLSSSKSTRIFMSEDVKDIVMDTLLLDSLIERW